MDLNTITVISIIETIKLMAPKASPLDIYVRSMANLCT